MHTPTHDTAHRVGSLVENARALLNATADVADDKINEARQRLAAAMSEGRGMVDRLREKAGEGTLAVGNAVRHHPYRAIAIGFGLGALLGILTARRGS